MTGKMTPKPQKTKAGRKRIEQAIIISCFAEEGNNADRN